jgi:DNA-directed RNA polymerase sigma subunit (sigma70/sigma32)
MKSTMTRKRSLLYDAFGEEAEYTPAMAKAVSDTLDRLDPRLKQILTLRYVNGLTLKQIGAQIQKVGRPRAQWRNGTFITVERVRQLNSKGLSRLRWFSGAIRAVWKESNEVQNSKA